MLTNDVGLERISPAVDIAASKIEDALTMENHTDTSPDPKELDEHKPKKRRLHGACDACRRKKIKCDSAETQPKRCTNCRASKIECTHDMPRQPKKSETQAAYIVSLEETIEKMRRLLQAVYTEKDLQFLLEKPLDELPNTTQPRSPDPSVSAPSPAASVSTPSSMSSVKLPKISSLSQEITHLAASPVTSDDEEDDPDDFAHLELAEHLKELCIDALEDRFFGRSSGFMFFKEAATLRGQLTGITLPSDSARFRRPMYWDVRPWELDYDVLPSHPPLYDYPDDDLLRSLVFIYFERFNPLFPLLHKPTFVRMLAENRHQRDQDFGMIVLMVCALASRYSHDPRVFSPGDSGDDGKGPKGLSSGWKYFKQVPMHRKSLLYRAGLFDLQYYVLATMYLVGTSIPQNSWNIVGILVRYLLEMGGHRRKPHSQKPTAEDELMKRVFWCVLYLDRLVSSFLGRPCLIQDEDYDIDFPIECDDEYWESPSGNSDDAFKQPPGKPSHITAFVCSLKLVQILGLSLRTLYSTKKAKALSGMVGGEWEQTIVAELDSSLNKWKDSVPAFLQWDPERENSTFFHQSVSIYATFYYVQIQVHRPFLMKKTPLSLSSLAMCTNAARSCARLLEVSLTRGMHVGPTLDEQVAAFCSGTVIVLNLWGIRHSGLLGDAAKEAVNLQKCINVLKECEKRWHVAGRACDMLKEAASLDDYNESAALLKRRREDPATNPTMPQYTTYAQPQRSDDANTTAFSFPNLFPSTTKVSTLGTGIRSPLNPNHSQVSMTHSMAITPVASISGAASTSPPMLTPAHSALGASTTMPMQPMPRHSYNPATNPLATDWDLGNLLMMQMGYSHYDPNAQFSVGQSLGDQRTPLVMTSPAQQTLNSNNNSLPPLGNMNRVPPLPQSSSAQDSTSASPESFGNTEDLLSLFSDVPMAFSLEEWDAYLASLGS